jgi:hypothetical protein
MTRVIGFFASRDALFETIADAKVRQLQVVTALLPMFDGEAIDAVGVPHTWAGGVAFAAGTVGGLFGLLFPAWTARQWPHVIIGGKPLMSWPTWLVIACETALLFAALAAFAAFFVGAWRGRRLAGRLRHLRANVSSVTDAAYALVLACPAGRVDEASGVMRARGASRCELV